MTQRRSLMRLAAPLMMGRGVAAVFTFLIPVVLARSLDQGSYGTYKQFFLIASTVYLIGQLGLVGSLYYFVPRLDGDGRGRVLIQTLLGLFIVGAVCAAGTALGADAIARRFSNPALVPLAVPLGLYLWAYLGAIPLEVSLTTSKHTGWAGLSYAVSDLLRTAALILPIKLGGSMVALAWAAAAWALVRLAAAWALVLTGRLGRPHLPSKTLLKDQIRYSLPIAGAILLTTLQVQLPQYVVSALTDASTYAIYAVGILQIPLTDMLYTPVAEVMMVRLAQAGPLGAPPIIREAIARLVMFFLPLTAFALAVGPEVIPTLYTPKYLASVPIFLIALLELPLSALPVDGLLRSLDMTGAVFRVGIVRLAIAIVAVPVGLEVLGLPGAMAAYILSQWSAKLLLLRMAARRCEVPASALIPWPELRGWALRAGAIFVVVTAVRCLGPWHGWPFLGGGAVLAAIIWGLGVLSARELRTTSAESALSTSSLTPASTPTAPPPPPTGVDPTPGGAPVAKEATG